MTALGVPAGERPGNRPGGLILAAGFSSRMGGSPKALVPLGGRTLLERMVAAFREAGIEPAVVAGHGLEDLETACARLGAELVHNREFAAGMFSSVQAGLRHLDGRGHGAVCITPVDAALVLPRTIRALINRWDAECPRPGEARRAIVPEFLGRPGHPLLLPARHCANVLSQQDDGGLRGYLARLPDSPLRLPLPDAGVLCDLDTAGDCGKAEAFLVATRDRADPSLGEAWQALLVSGLAAKAVRHSLLAAFGAHRLWQRARAQGRPLSENMGAASFPVLCAGLLHDLARAEPDHARRGAERLREFGWLDVAFAVENHMDFPVSLLEILESGPVPGDGDFARALGSACIYLADKCAGNGEFLPFAARFAERREQWRHDETALAAIDAREAVSRRLEAWFAAAMNAGIVDVLRAPSGDAVEAELKALAEKTPHDGDGLWPALSCT